MDKVKQILELLRKHHFWILCGLAALASLIAWSLSTGSLATQFQSNVGAIQQKIDSLNSPVEAHVDWKPAMDKETEAVALKVKAIWDTLYQQQKEKVFIWPTAYGQDFLQALQKIEGTKDELREGLLVRYQNMVTKQVKRLPEIIDADSSMDPQASANAAAAASAASLNGVPVGPEHRVVWQPTSQQEIFETFNWDKAPTTLVVKQAQEELWVYQALLNVIATVNDGSHGPADAAVKELTALAIAYNAVEDSPGGAGPSRFGRDSLVVNDAGGAAAAPAQGSESPKTRPNPRERCKDTAGGSDHGFTSPAPTEGAGGNPDDKWKNFRYVNAKGEPVMQAELDAGTSEFNLMPFLMDLKMDERYIDRFLVDCRNSVLPIEVQQVRVNPLSINGGAGGGGSYVRPSMGGGERGPTSSPMSAGGGTQGQERVVTVEIRGVVSILQPPKLPATQAAPAEPGTAPETPSPTVPATAATTPAPGGAG